MSVVIRLKVPIEMHYTVIPMGTSKVNSSPSRQVMCSQLCDQFPAVMWTLGWTDLGSVYQCLN